jgi:hypothetical protein
MARWQLKLLLEAAPCPTSIAIFSRNLEWRRRFEVAQQKVYPGPAAMSWRSAAHMISIDGLSLHSYIA